MIEITVGFKRPGVEEPEQATFRVDTGGREGLKQARAILRLQLIEQALTAADHCWAVDYVTREGV